MNDTYIEMEQELEEKLKVHDWTYMYSDDGSAYRRGEEQSTEIRKLTVQLREMGRFEEVEALVNQYSPWRKPQ